MSDTTETRQRMSEKQKAATTEWFSLAKDGLEENIAALRRLIRRTPALSAQKSLLQGELARLSGLLAMLERREEAFVADNSTQAIRPPSDEVIDKTKRISAQMAEAIAQQKKAEAIAALVDELVGLVTKVSRLGETEPEEP